LLQQTPPFTAASPVELLSKHMFATPPPLRRSESSEPIPPALERLRLELLAKRPEQRPKSATDAREQLFAAMSSPEAVGRKSAVAALPREERAPELATPPLAAPRDGEAQHIGLIRQGEREGLSASDAVGLAAHGVELVALSKLADAERVSAVIVDAADDAAFATRTIVALRALEKPPLVVVCARAIEVIDINALVAAGAADVIRLPATAEAIARRALRVVRRRR
jgi:serine/threonine-protein kinase